MSNFTVKLYDSSKSLEQAIDSITSICISKNEGVPPKAVIYIRNCELETNITTCEIYEENKLIFSGSIEKIEYEYPHVYRIEATVVPNFPTEVNEEAPSDDLLSRFKSENPDLFENSEAFEISSLGEKIPSNLLNPPNSPVDVTERILKGSLFVSKNPTLPLSELNLEIKGSWIARKTGDFNLSRKIENHFKKSKINTLTPLKLKNSWPSFGDRIRNNKSSSSKYFVSMTRLWEEKSESMPTLNISEKVPNIRLMRTYFNNAFSISWDYEQYTTEKLNLKLTNKLAKNNTTKNFKINLNNVQEYIESPYSKSFFFSKIGQEIINFISSAFQKYLILSMRNVRVSCELIDFHENLDCSNWVKILGVPYKITSIEKEYTHCGVKTKLQCRGFSERLPNIDTTKNKVYFTNDPVQEFDENEVIQDIIVENEADTQYSKLKEYIANIPNSIDMKNYRSLISKFLNNNPTKISIITKPLKTKSCEIMEYNANTINLF